MDEKTKALLFKLKELLPGEQIYLVGGATRDLLLGKPVSEYDFTTSASVEKFERALRQASPYIDPKGKAFGTLAGEILGARVEITCFRSETYDRTSRKPKVKPVRTLEEDLKRRDFTINSIAWDGEKVYDPMEGLRDLKQKTVRFTGCATDRILEDPLRMLRAIRFACDLGFKIAPDDWQTILEHKDEIVRVAPERIRVELEKILLAEKPSRGLDLLYQSRLYPHFLPLDDLVLEPDFPLHHKDVYQHTLKVVDRAPPRLKVRWAALLHDFGKKETRGIVDGKVHFLGHESVSAMKATKILRRLGYANAFVEDVSFLVRYHLYLHGYGVEGQEWTDSAVRRFVRHMGDRLEDFFSLALADITSGNPRKVERIEARIEALKRRIKKLEEEEEIKKIKPLLDGKEIMALLNIPPSPLVGKAKNFVFEKQLDLGASYTKEQAIRDVLNRFHEEARQLNAALKS